MIYFVCWARRVHKQYNKARQINTTYTANFSHAPHRKIRSCIRQSQSREDSARVVIWSGYPLNFQAAVSPQGLLARRASLANPSIHDAQRRCLPGRLTRRRSSTRVPNMGMFDFRTRPCPHEGGRFQKFIVGASETHPEIETDRPRGRLGSPRLAARAPFRGAPPSPRFPTGNRRVTASNYSWPRWGYHVHRETFRNRNSLMGNRDTKG
jgi:hypothetical protein